MKMIKLGNTWINSHNLAAISSSRPPLGLVISADGNEAKPVPNGKNSNHVSVVLRDGRWLTISYFDTIEAADKFADECAQLVNEAIREI